MTAALVSRISLVDRTTEVIREGLNNGRWKKRIPGQRKLAVELGVSRKTLAASVAKLAAEGAIRQTGSRKAAAVAVKPVGGSPKAPSLRVAMLTLQPLDEQSPEMRWELQGLLADLRRDGHSAIPVALPSGKDTQKTGHLAKLVADVGADAWIVVNGSEEILRWFSRHDTPALALGGRATRVPIAGLAMCLDAFTQKLVRRLADSGHRRIVLIAPRAWRLPTPGKIPLDFRKALESVGVRPGEFHTPDWEETPRGLEKLMGELFRVTPPTALLCWTTNTTYGVLGWLVSRGFKVPGDVSVVSLEEDRPCNWFSPGLRIAHAKNNDDKLLRLTRDWVAGVASGVVDKKQRVVSPTLVPGTSLGPAKA